MITILWILIAALGWSVGAIWWWMSRRWQKLASDEAQLVQRYASLLTESMKLTDAALTDGNLYKHEAARLLEELARGQSREATNAERIH